MNYQYKTKSELIKELRRLQQKYDSLEILSSKDNTRGKLIENSLRESEERYRMIFENSGEAILLTNPDGSIYSANPEACRIFGMSEAEICEKRRNGIVDLNDNRIEPALNERNKTGKFKGDLNLLKKDGTKIPAEVVSNVFIDSSGNVRTSMIIRDISERKQAEEAKRESEARFRSFFENSLIGISAASPDGKLLQANPAYARMYGYENPEEMLAEVTGVGVLFANPADRKEVLRILLRKGFMEAREVEVVRRDGSRFFVLVSACEIRDDDGKFLYNQAIHLDHSEQKKIEEELRNSKKLLEKLNHHLQEIRENERADISREIHDELGQSLTALKLDLNQMSKFMSTNPEAVMKLESMIELVSNTIKDVQRISSDLRPGILDDLGLVSAIEWYCDEFEKRTGIKCNLELDNSDYSDSRKNLVFFRAIQETLTNVIRHAMASSISIKLHQSNKGTTMTMQDNGIGIHKDKIGSNKSLGLLSMRERVRQFNGKVEISSKKGYGTKLAVFIPS